jgi:hypothetical protein
MNALCRREIDALAPGARPAAATHHQVTSPHLHLTGSPHVPTHVCPLSDRSTRRRRDQGGRLEPAAAAVAIPCESRALGPGPPDGDVLGSFGSSPHL